MPVLRHVTVDGAGTPVSWYFTVLAGAKPVGRAPNVGSRVYYHADLLGSTRAVVSGASVVESYDYDPYGVLLPGRTLGSGTKEGFTGKERDLETGMDYFGARYYLAALGRWGSVDAMADSLPSWSAYNYAFANPVSYRDPSGRCPEFITGRPCSNTVAIAVGFIPVVGDVYDIASAVVGKDLLTGEKLDAVAIGATVVGTILGSGKLARAGAEVVDDAVKLRRAASSATELRRPYIRKGVRETVERRAARTSDGRYLDANTGRPIDGKYDLGHRRGHEFRREKARAEKEGLTQKEFNNRMNNPDLYQIEDPRTNRSHVHEKKP